MAKYYSSTFGKISGKHGTAVAVIMKDGSTYLRKYTKPSNPRTEKQQAHRAKFALSSKALVPFNPIFKETIGITNGISIARSYAFKNTIVGEYPNLYMDYEKLMFSFGPIEKLQNTSITRNERIISIQWDFKKMHNCQNSDNVNLIIFNKIENQVIHLKDVAERSEKKYNIDIHENWAYSELYVWAYVKHDDKVSDSVFIGSSAPTDRCDCNEDKLIDNEHINSPTYSAINNTIISFIIMLHNLFGFFKQIVINTNIQHSANSCIHKHISTPSHIKSSNKQTALAFNLKSSKIASFTAFCNKHKDRHLESLHHYYSNYKNIFTPILMSIIRPDDKLYIEMC